MPECQNCGHHVTERYATVFADNSGVLHACSSCRDQTSMFHGAGVELLKANER